MPSWLDISPYLDQLVYTLLRIVTDAAFALNDLLLGAAWITLAVRQVVVNGAAFVISRLYEAFGPFWLTVIVMAAVGTGLITVLRWLFNSFSVSSLEKIVGVTIIAFLLMLNGEFVVGWYEWLRVGLATLTYRVAQEAISTTGVTLGGGGQAVPVNCRLSSVDRVLPPTEPPDNPRCTGYELALSYLLFTDENQIFTFKAGPDFSRRYFSVNGGSPVDPSAVPTMTAGDRQVLLANATNGPVIALTGVPVSIMGVIEGVVWLLLSLAALLCFLGLGVGMIFAVLDFLPGTLSQIVDQLKNLLQVSAQVGLLMGLVTGFMLLAQHSAALYVGTSCLGSIVYIGLLVTAGQVVLRNFSGPLGVSPGSLSRGMHEVQHAQHTAESAVGRVVHAGQTVVGGPVGVMASGVGGAFDLGRALASEGVDHIATAGNGPRLAGTPSVAPGVAEDDPRLDGTASTAGASSAAGAPVAAGGGYLTRLAGPPPPTWEERERALTAPTPPELVEEAPESGAAPASPPAAPATSAARGAGTLPVQDMTGSALGTQAPGNGAGGAPDAGRRARALWAAAPAAQQAAGAAARVNSGRALGSGWTDVVGRLYAQGGDPAQGFTRLTGVDPESRAGFLREYIEGAQRHHLSTQEFADMSQALARGDYDAARAVAGTHMEAYELRRYVAVGSRVSDWASGVSVAPPAEQAPIAVETPELASVEAPG